MKTITLSLSLLFFTIYSWSQFGPPNSLYSSEIHGNARQTRIFDMDADGDLDIVTFNFYRVFWFENSGFGTFSEAQLILADGGLPTGYEDLEISDFDGDGLLDIIYRMDAMFDIVFIKNLGGGVFSDPVTTDIEAATGEIHLGDMDGDGDDDILVCTDFTMKWGENDGTGDIEAVHDLSLDTYYADDVKLADYDNDSDLDVFFISDLGEEGGIYMFENLGAGVFADAETISADISFGTSIHFEDLDGDLDLDILATSAGDSKTIWHENLGAGTFGPEIIISTTSLEPTQVFTADLDNDGDADVLISSAADDKLVWFENNGDATFEPEAIISGTMDSAHGINAMDVDMDGDLDVIGSGHSEGAVSWFENHLIDPSIIEGQLFIDENENGIMDIDEEGMIYANLYSDPSGALAITHPDGTFLMDFDLMPEDTYSVYPELENWYITSPYLTYEVVVEDPFPYTDTVSFGLFPDTFIDTISTSLVNGAFPRCFWTIPYWLNVRNEGTTTPSGIIHLELDDSLVFDSADILPDSIVGQNVYWSYEDLFYFDSETILAWVTMPDGIEDTLSSVLTTTITDAGAVIFTASDTLNEIVTCSYDPNDKSVDPKGETELGLIAQDTEWLEYTVRFHNTGTDTAYLVIVKDQLDENLDWLTFEPLFSSHSMYVDFNPGGELAFVFEDINLPDSIVNEEASHGFLQYRIKLKEDLPYGTTIENTAEIYFDFNAPIITNTAINTIAEPESNGLEDMVDEEPNIMLYPNPATDLINVYFSHELDESYDIVLYDLLGNIVYQKNNLNGNKTEIQSKEFGAGIYVITIYSHEDGRALFNAKVILE